jgi:hypothetical protein
MKNNALWHQHQQQQTKAKRKAKNIKTLRRKQKNGENQYRKRHQAYEMKSGGEESSWRKHLGIESAAGDGVSAVESNNGESIGVIKAMAIESGIGRNLASR